jgi:paraquat-inducible protein B
MSQKPNPTLIGAFVLGGLALAVAGVALFGSGRLFRPKGQAILYFAGSLNGLEPGAAVKLKGVRIGQVSQVMIGAEPGRTQIAMPVLVEIDLQELQKKLEDPVDLDRRRFLEFLVSHGFRGRLEFESFVTGRLYVELDVDPGAAPPVFRQRGKRYVEIPTVPSDLSSLKETLKSLDLKGVIAKLDSILDKVDRGLAEVQFGEINAGVLRTLDAAERLLQSSEVTNAFVSLRAAAEEIRGVATRLQAQLDPQTGQLGALGTEATRTLEELRRAAAELRGILESDSPLLSELQTSLSQVGAAARSMRFLADYLARNPQAVLGGRRLPARTTP